MATGELFCVFKVSVWVVWSHPLLSHAGRQQLFSWVSAYSMTALYASRVLLVSHPGLASSLLFKFSSSSELSCAGSCPLAPQCWLLTQAAWSRDRVMGSCAGMCRSLQPLCPNSHREGCSAAYCSSSLSSGSSVHCQPPRSVPSGLPFPVLLQLKFIPAKLNTRFLNGG